MEKKIAEHHLRANILRDTGTREGADAAILEIRAALSLLDENENLYSRAHTLGLLGTIWREHPDVDRSGNLERAIESFSRGAEVAEQAGESRLAASLLRDVATILKLRHEGDKAENAELALEYVRRAAAAADKGADPVFWGETQANLGLTLLERPYGSAEDNVEEALGALLSALAVFASFPALPHFSRTSLDVANAYHRRVRGRRMDNEMLGEQYLRAALDRLSPTAHPSLWALIQSSLGLQVGLTDAEEGIAITRRALDVWKAAGLAPERDWDPIKASPTQRKEAQDWFNALHNLSFLYRTKADGVPGADLDSSISLLQQIIDVCTASLPQMRRLAAIDLCEIYVESGAWIKALGAAEIAHKTLMVDDSRTPSVLSFNESSLRDLGLHARLVEIHLQLKNTEAALYYADEALAPRLRKEIGFSSRIRPESLPESFSTVEEDLVTEWKKGTDRLHRLENTAERGLGNQVASIETDLRDIFKVYGNLFGDACTADIRLGKVSSWRNILSWLRQQSISTAIASIELVDGKVGIFWLDGTRSQPEYASTSIAADTVDRVKREFGAWVATVPSPTDPEPGWHRELADIIRAIETRINGSKRLYIVPGSLNGVPLHAIEVEGRSILDMCSVAYAPSVSVLMAIDKRPRFGRRESAVIVADLTGALPGAEREAQQLARLLGLLQQKEYLWLLISNEASDQPLLESFSGLILPTELSRRDVVHRALNGTAHVHFSAHGVHVVDDPEQSGVLLSDGETFSCREIRTLRGPPDTVFLGVCDTGVSEAHEWMREFSGVPRAFLYAGTRTVVETLWRVPDQDGADLVVDVYAKLLRGQTFAAALRDAMLSRRKRNSWYWAQFVVYGVDGYLPNVGEMLAPTPDDQPQVRVLHLDHAPEWLRPAKHPAA
ncbi:CHAT domain-containing protein [Mesorhizobium sp. M0814]|uniref:CHAT domain-containing protein n=1 Tax=Mesorhizobium sp. M0814 TaxID=2957004 RepID=UPI00333A4376